MLLPTAHHLPGDQSPGPAQLPETLALLLPVGAPTQVTGVNRVLLAGSLWASTQTAGAPDLQDLKPDNLNVELT